MKRNWGIDPRDQSFGAPKNALSAGALKKELGAEGERRGRNRLFGSGGGEQR